MKSEFITKVIAIVRSIPEGATMSYADVAALAGSSGAARAIGMILKHNTDSSVPCHRVIRADGSLGGYNGLRGAKRNLLAREGVKV